MRITARVGQQQLDVIVKRENGKYLIEVDGVPHQVDAIKLEGDFYSILMHGRSYEVSVEATSNGYHVRHGAAEQVVSFTDPGRRAREAARSSQGPEKVVSAMPGKIVRVLVSVGDVVEPGQGLVVVEAMKMENEIAATKGGTITSIIVAPGQTVEGGGPLAVIE